MFAVQLPEMKVKWQKVLSSKIEGPPVVATKNVLVSLKEGKVKGYNMVTGKEAWEEDLKSPLQGQPTYVPIYNRAVAITKNGYLHVIDLDAGDRLWRFRLDNENDLKIPWTTRLSGKFIEALSMKWKYKGWTIWSPCVKDRICIYNPSEGQIVGRVMLSGNLLTQPLFAEQSFQVVLRTENGYTITKYEERGGAIPKPTPKKPAVDSELDSVGETM
jgi:outer membrane protein assembly factor BamB